MVSRDLFFQINARLLEIFMCSIAVEPAGLAVVLAEQTEVMRQKGDAKIIDLLNKIRI